MAPVITWRRTTPGSGRDKGQAPLWRAVKTVELSAPTEYDGEHPQNNWRRCKTTDRSRPRDNDVLGRGAVPLAISVILDPDGPSRMGGAEAPPNSEAENHSG